jgi:hypothetical protein
MRSSSPANQCAPYEHEPGVVTPPFRLPEDGWIYGHEMMGRVAGLRHRVKTTRSARSGRATVPDSLYDELVAAP